MTSQPPGETYQELGEDCQKHQIHHVSDGRNDDRQKVVCRDIVSDRSIALPFCITIVFSLLNEEYLSPGGVFTCEKCNYSVKTRLI